MKRIALMLMIPLLVLAAGLLFFRERLTKRQCLGVGLILAALVLLNL